MGRNIPTYVCVKYISFDEMFVINFKFKIYRFVLNKKKGGSKTTTYIYDTKRTLA